MSSEVSENAEMFVAVVVMVVKVVRLVREEMGDDSMDDPDTLLRPGH